MHIIVEPRWQQQTTRRRASTAPTQNAGTQFAFLPALAKVIGKPTSSQRRIYNIWLSRARFGSLWRSAPRAYRPTPVASMNDPVCSRGALRQGLASPLRIGFAGRRELRSSGGSVPRGRPGPGQSLARSPRQSHLMSLPLRGSTRFPHLVGPFSCDRLEGKATPRRIDRKHRPASKQLRSR